MILDTGRSVYTVALRHLVEQRADWSWAAIQIVEKKAASEADASGCGRRSRPAALV